MTDRLIHIAYARPDGRAHFLCGAPSVPIRYRDTGNSRLRPIATTPITCPDCLELARLDSSLESKPAKHPTAHK